MRIARTTRALLCLLIAASTAIGVTLPVRACACSIPSPIHPQAVPAESQGPQMPAAKHACCPPKPGGKACCCCEPPAADPQPAPTSRAPQAACGCVACDCGPHPPEPVPPAAATPDLDDVAASESPAPPVSAASPHTAARAFRAPPAAPPVHLLLSLARLTC
ncbi:hypothetical protein [Gemmata sp.]|uniref:hypothetical protein n=1 Tax=Gemmata sp. TaxID=1914242 RepID=UPI003F6E5BFB